MDLTEIVPLVMHFDKKKNRQVIEKLAKNVRRKGSGLLGTTRL